MTRVVLRGVPVDGVLFDIDDTLVDSRGAFAAALDAIAEVWLPDLPPERRPLLLEYWRNDAARWYGRYTRGEVSYHEQRMARANRLHREFGGQELDDHAFSQWSEIFERRVSQSWRPHADALPLVDVLTTAGVRVGALSNAGSAYQIAKLETAGLSDRVPMLVGVDTLGFGKPDPRVFMEACRRLGTDPSHTVYIGDELDVDARAASAAGLMGIWLNRDGGGVVAPNDSTLTAGEATMTIQSLAQVPALLTLG